MQKLLRHDGPGVGGLFLVAIGLAHREGFFSLPGIILLLVGLGVLLLALRAMAVDAEPGDGHTVLFLVLCVVAALAPYDPGGINGFEVLATAGAALAFLVMGAIPAASRYRLYVAALLLVAAHAHYLLRFPHPIHQDVWTFLNGGADLLARGQDPYSGVAFVEDGLHKVVPFTYPPGALVVLAPFRVVAGDVRWAYVVSEALVVGLWGWWLSTRGELTRAREALILVPLVLPRTSQAFYIFSNHEWVLLALALGALVLAARQHHVAAGVVLGLGIVTKQYFLVFPLLFVLPLFQRRSLVVAALTAVVVTAPFLAWAPADFLRDVFGNLGQAPVSDRLTLWALMAHLGIVLPRAGLILLSAAALGVTGWVAWATRRQPGRALVGCGLCLGFVALSSSFSAYNYYAYGLVFITWGLLWPSRPRLAG